MTGTSRRSNKRNAATPPVDSAVHDTSPPKKTRYSARSATPSTPSTTSQATSDDTLPTPSPPQRPASTSAVATGVVSEAADAQDCATTPTEWSSTPPVVAASLPDPQDTTALAIVSDGNYDSKRDPIQTARSEQDPATPSSQVDEHALASVPDSKPHDSSDAQGHTDDEMEDLFAGAIDPMDIRPRPLLTVDTHPTYPEAFLKVLNQLTAYSSVPRLVYAMNQVPPTITWGYRREGGRENEYMTISNRPITVYIIGELVSAHFFNDGKPLRRMTVQIKPIVPSDETKALHILSRYSNPEIPPETFNGLWVIKWNGAYGAPESDLRPFRELFDGTEKFHKGYPPMNRLKAVDFSVGDIVLVEAFIHRWLDVPAGEKAKFRNEAWPRWRAEYRLEAMSLLMTESALLTAAAHANDDTEG